MLEQRERGFVTDRYVDEVCGHCIDDPALAAFAAGHGPIKECGFCGRTESLGTRLGELFHFMAECLSTEWDDPINEVAWDHGFDDFVEIIDSEDLLWELDSPLANVDLHAEFVSAFEHQWCQINPYRLERAEVLFHSWKHFSNIVKTQQAIPASPNASQDDSDELLDPTEVLGAIGDAIAEADSRMLRQSGDVRLCRARRHKPSEAARNAKQLGSAPPEGAQHNRMSKAGVSMFYGAETEDTARAEIRHGAGQAVTTGIWTPSRELVYLDLPAALPIPSLFDTASLSHRTSLRFLHAFAEDLARPIDADDALIDYIPTQFATEYMRGHLRTQDGRAIDAIRYRSAVDKPNGVCWVVFAGHDACVDSDSDAAVQANSQAELLMILDTDSVRRHE